MRLAEGGGGVETHRKLVVSGAEQLREMEAVVDVQEC